MNRVKFLDENWDDKEKQSQHIHVLESKIPETLDEMQLLIRALADALAQGSKTHDKPLASVAYGFVDGKGACPELCEQIAEKLHSDPNRLCLAFLCAFGKALLDAETELIEDKLKADGLDNMTPEWLVGHFEECSFSWAAFNMEKLTCDCPACVMFWAAKAAFTMSKTPAELVDEFLTLMKSDPERGNAGCIKHKLPGEVGMHWLHLESEEEET